MRVINLAEAVAAAQNHRLALLLVCAGVASHAAAVDYSAIGNVNFDASRNDNIRMAEHDKTAVNKYLLSPQIRFNANSETTSVGLQTLLYFNRYDKSEYDSDDQNIGLSFGHQFERSTVGLNANLVRESTITSETETSGIVGVEADRTERYVIAPSWSYLLNDTNQIQLQADYQKQDYRNRNYTGYDNIAVMLDWVHIYTERLKLVASLRYSDYQSEYIMFDVPQVPRFGVPAGFLGEEGYSTRTRDKGGQVGFDYQWSEQSLLQVRAGGSHSTNSYPLKNEDEVCRFGLTSEILGAICNPDESSDNLFTANVNWTWSNENHTVSLNASKETQPSSNGYTVDATVIGTSWNYKMTELDQFSASVSLRRNGQKGSSDVRNGTIADRDYQSAQVGYTRRLNENWSVNTGYQYNHQKYDDADFKASSNIFSIGVRYQPREWHWAR